MLFNLYTGNSQQYAGNFSVLCYGKCGYILGNVCGHAQLLEYNFFMCSVNFSKFSYEIRRALPRKYGQDAIAQLLSSKQCQKGKEAFSLFNRFSIIHTQYFPATRQCSCVWFQLGTYCTVVLDNLPVHYTVLDSLNNRGVLCLPSEISICILGSVLGIFKVGGFKLGHLLVSCSHLEGAIGNLSCCPFGQANAESES